MHLEGSKIEKFSAGGGNPPSTPPQITILKNSRLGKKWSKGNVRFTCLRLGGGVLFCLLT